MAAIPIRVGDAELAKYDALGSFHAVSLGAGFMIEARQVQYAMHDKMGGVVRDGFVLLGGFAGDRFVSECYVAQKYRPRAVPERPGGGRRRKRQHVCGGVLPAKRLVERANLGIGHKRNAYRMRFGRKLNRRQGCFGEARDQFEEAGNGVPALILD